VDLASETTIEQGLRFETAAIRATLASEDYAIGLAAFAEKYSVGVSAAGLRRGGLGGSLTSAEIRIETPRRGKQREPPPVSRRGFGRHP
jgi:hypothetical protein